MYTVLCTMHVCSTKLWLLFATIRILPGSAMRAMTIFSPFFRSRVHNPLFYARPSLLTRTLRHQHCKFFHYKHAAKQESRQLFAISLGDIHKVPTRSKFTFFQVFLNFWSNAPKCRSLGGGVCVCFSKSVRKGRFRNVWVGGGVGGHSFAHRAVNGTTHRAQAMHQRSLIIPNPICCCPFPQGPGLHWGTHPPTSDWEHTSSIFPNPAACVPSLAPTLCSGHQL